MWIKVKLFFNRPIAKRTVYSIFALFLIAIFVVPSVFSFLAFNNNNVFAYTRDHSSGTFEAFDEKVLGNDENEKPQKFSKNVMEVASNDRMVSNVQANANTIGYVSLGTIGAYDSNDKFVKDSAYNDISILKYEGVSPEKKDNIAIKNTKTNKNNKYTPSRNFNQFFRVENNSKEAEILKIQPDFSDQQTFDSYTYWNTTEANLVLIQELSNEEKIAYAYYQWILHSLTAENIIEADGEISSGQEKWENNVETKAAEKELMQILYGKNVKIKPFNKKVKIEQVGSTSVQAIITDFEKELSNPEHTYNTTDYNIDISHSPNGSGDASKLNPPAGTKSPYIGFQSREPQSDGTTFEYSAWGYQDLDELEASGAYDAIAIDAIAIIANNDGLNVETKRGNKEIDNITEEIIRKIYYEGGLSWQELYDLDNSLVSSKIKQ